MVEWDELQEQATPEQRKTIYAQIVRERDRLKELVRCLTSSEASTVIEIFHRAYGRMPVEIECPTESVPS